MYSVTEVVVYIHDDKEWKGLEHIENLEVIVEEIEGLSYVESCEFNYNDISSMAVTIDMGGDWSQERVDQVVEKIQDILDTKRKR